MRNDSINKNKLFNKKNFSNWIIGAIIAVIITKVSDPLGEFLFSQILNMGGRFITHISNSTYKEISNGFSEQSSLITLYLVFLLFVLLLTAMYFILFQKYKTRKNKLKKIFTSIDNSTTISEKNEIVESDNFKEQNLETKKTRLKKFYDQIFFHLYLIHFGFYHYS